MSSCNTKEKQQELLNYIVTSFQGEYDNFQQAWQENTEEYIHRVEVAQKHRHLHTIFDKPIHLENGEVLLFMRHYENRDTLNIIGENQLRFLLEGKEHSIVSYFSETPKPNTSIRETEKLYWISKGNFFEGIGNKNISILIENGLMEIHQKEGLFANKEPYKMKKCRLFSGWIEYPLPDNPDTYYRMKNLIIHDQGGIAQLISENGIPMDYTVELTQLVYGKTIAIMKLAVYDQPLNEIDYNSRAISYTWTNPKAKRIGINLRKVVSGWTLIEPGYRNSDNTEMKEAE